jgi:glycogen phosphorylase
VLHEELKPLYDLALDLAKSSTVQADPLWSYVAPQMWNQTHNPWLILRTLTEQRIAELKRDGHFWELLEQQSRVSPSQGSWFQKSHPESQLSKIAYFCMEFGISEALPIYSGGLGILAGDHLKTASDLGLPLVAVGLLYQQGYFRQMIDASGAQHEFFPTNNPTQLPIVPALDAEGDPLVVTVNLPGRILYLGCWQAMVGKVTLYLLDSNLLVNSPADRGITAELYGGSSEMRLQQEIALGIGGWRALQRLNILPNVCHLNEGHAAFAVFERARSCMHDFSLPFKQALEMTRVSNLFTTHTPVSAGFDRFDPKLMVQYFTAYASELAIPVEELIELGRVGGDPNEPFNMAYLAVRGSAAVNGVSRLHGEVSRRLFSPLFPNVAQGEIPIGYITNGVHVPSWESVESDALWERVCGECRWEGTLDDLEAGLRRVSDRELWEFRSASRGRLVDYARLRLSQSLAARGCSAEEVAAAGEVLDPNCLTLGFARRFTAYKRPNLLLHNKERLVAMFRNSQRPIQLVLAGKAHPQDEQGKREILEWMEFISHTDVRHRIVFLSDYDILVAERLVQGVDVWINTPRRPWEASGTSGMKVLVNGGVNLSELDGWWAEAYEPEVGWALGDGKEHADETSWDAQEAEALYGLLENEVVLQFYDRNADGIPVQWLSRVRESMARLTPRFSTNRMVREYTDHYYVRAATAHHKQVEGLHASV